MSEELKPEKIPETQEIPVPTESPEPKANEPQKITNEKELSREQKTAVKKLKDYSREAKKRVKQSDREKDNEDEKKDEAEAKSQKSEISFNTYATVIGVLTAIAGLYYTYRTYVIEESKNNNDDPLRPKIIDLDAEKKQPKKTPKFRTL